MDQYLRFLWLIPLGFFAGGYGTLIGAGGGFVLTPALLLLYPGEAPETITSISLATVFVNALSSTFAYAKSRRIDYKSGIIFALATTPGVILGALATTAMSRAWFDPLFGFLLVLVAILLAVSPGRKEASKIAQAGCGTIFTFDQAISHSLSLWIHLVLASLAIKDRQRENSYYCEWILRFFPIMKIFSFKG